MTKEKLVEKIRELLNADRDLNFCKSSPQDAKGAERKVFSIAFDPG